MNKEIAGILRDKLQALPFIDLLGGLALTVSREQRNEAETQAILQRFPVCTEVIGGNNCVGPEIEMSPDSSRKSIIFFEDFGINPLPTLHGLQGFNSSLRLICWMNRKNLVGDTYTPLAGRAMAAIIARLKVTNPESVGMFTRLTIDLLRVPPQDANIFGRYSFKETQRQYLRPPFDFFALDFSIKFYVSPNCLTDINWNLSTC